MTNAEGLTGRVASPDGTLAPRSRLPVSRVESASGAPTAGTSLTPSSQSETSPETETARRRAAAEAARQRALRLMQERQAAANEVFGFEATQASGSGTSAPEFPDTVDAATRQRAAALMGGDAITSRLDAVRRLQQVAPPLATRHDIERLQAELERMNGQDRLASEAYRHLADVLMVVLNGMSTGPAAMAQAAEPTAVRAVDAAPGNAAPGRTSIGQSAGAAVAQGGRDATAGTRAVAEAGLAPHEDEDGRRVRPRQTR
jgi:hypothetical protein